MSNYYRNQFLDLNTLGQVSMIFIDEAGTTTKNMTLNKESINELRRFLDRFEERLAMGDAELLDQYLTLNSFPSVAVNGEDDAC